MPARLTKQIAAQDDELAFLEEIEKHNQGVRASRKRTQASRAALLLDFLNESKIPKIGDKVLQKSVNGYGRRRKLLNGKRPAPVSVHTIKETRQINSDNSSGSVSTTFTHKSDLLEKDAKPVKLWLMAGLHSKAKHSRGRKPKFTFPLPMGAGLRALNTRRDFKIPWNIYCPSNGERKVVKWKSLKRNAWQSASQHSKVIKVLRSKENEICDCEGSQCGESCFNRLFQIECDAHNCGIGATKDCGNRNFANYMKKLSANDRYINGVEVVATGDKGNGLRAVRSYEPHSFIIEYTGEVIDQEEVESRLNEEYNGHKNHFYFLSLGHGLSIDGGTRGSVARFANHSCEPNAEIQKWIVNGEPRIGLFAGSKGIQPGQEITYHYNFEWFPNAEPQPCFCGAAKCSGYIGKRTDSASSKASSPSTPQSPRQVSPVRRARSQSHVVQKRVKKAAVIPSVVPKIATATKQKRPTTAPANPYEKSATPPPSRRRRRSDSFSFLQLADYMPLSVQRQLSINMAPPGKEIDDVALGISRLAANAALNHEDFEVRRPRTRHAESDSAVDAGIPLKFLKTKGDGEIQEAVKPARQARRADSVTPLSQRKSQTPTGATRGPRKKVTKRVSRRAVVQSSSDSEDEQGLPHVPNKLLPTRPLDQFELEFHSRKYINMLKKLAIDHEVPAIMERTSRTRNAVSVSPAPVSAPVLVRKKKIAHPEPKRKRGRPRKVPQIPVTSSSNSTDDTTSTQAPEISKPKIPKTRRETSLLAPANSFVSDFADAVTTRNPQGPVPSNEGTAVSKKKTATPVTSTTIITSTPIPETSVVTNAADKKRTSHVLVKAKVTPQVKQESSTPNAGKVQQKVSKNLIKLMIDDKMPAVFERSPRSSSTHSSSKKMYPTQILRSYPPPPPAVNFPLIREPFYPSEPIVKKKVRHPKITVRPRSAANITVAPRHNGHASVSNKENGYSIKGANGSEEQNGNKIKLPGWLPLFSSAT